MQEFTSEYLGIIKKCESKLESQFKTDEEVALLNTQKVLNALSDNNVALRHFAGTTGYGYDDVGRDTLCAVYAQVFGCEDAIVSPYFASGTHALAVALFGLLRPNDLLLSISGELYDTLCQTVSGVDCGSLADYGVKFKQIDLIDGEFDYLKIKEALRTSKPKVTYIQRSRGYSWRSSFTTEELQRVIAVIKEVAPQSIIMIDNCYGEFVSAAEPSELGADVLVGSLNKNIGGGIVPNGGYVAGKKEYVTLIANRLTAPAIGKEIGSYEGGYRLFYQGLFMAPHIVLQAKKSARLLSAVFNELGYEAIPSVNEELGDIICSVKLGDEEKLIALCKAVQRISPVDSNLTPEPWEMPGYDCKVIMAAGCFVQGASIELSCDAPLKPPFIAYLQGSLNYEHTKLAALEIIKVLNKNK